ncbi:MAG: hypothetical protein FJ404_08120 [Verrucomicrobia bacterium]|nr:hypothetical protein [Verrucomicrobiota bacterium]
MQEPPSEASFRPGREWGIGLNVALGAAALLAIVVMANYLSARHFRRWDLTGDPRFQLSAMTLGLLRSVTNDVEVTILIDPAESATLYGAVTGLLDAYENASPRIKVHRIDPTRAPGAAQLALARHKIAEAEGKNLVLFSHQQRVKPVFERELVDYDLDTAVRSAMAGATNAIKRKSFKGELQFSSAIYAVLEPRADKAYFVTGHREFSPDNNERAKGYSQFAGILTSRSIDFETLSLRGAQEVPPDCRLLIIAGPLDPFQPDEAAKVERYLNRGGKALMLFGIEPLLYGKPGVGQLDRVLAAWGVQVGGSLVYDREESVSGQDLLVTRFGSHPIARAMTDAQLYFALPRPVRPVENKPSGADAPQVTELLLTGPKAVTASDISAEKVRIHPAKDRTGTVSLAVAVERGAIQGISDGHGSTRLVVIGDPSIFANRTIDSVANRDFAGLVLNWLLDRSELLGGIEPRPFKEYQLALSQEKSFWLRWSLLAGVPGACLLPGVLVWFRRRK